jgi:hypothetical protein
VTGANLSQANLNNANFSGVQYCDEFGLCDIAPGANLTNANLSGADARGANFQYATLTGANTANLIQSDGHIAGLDLTAGKRLLVRDYDGNPAASPPIEPLPIVVEDHLTMDATGTLHLILEADAWNSTISFAPGIPVTLGGTLHVTFADGVSLSQQIGRAFDLFDWTGVNPTGTFDVQSPHEWDLSKLYSSGEVTFLADEGLAGDFNNDGSTDSADYLLWRKGLGTTYTQAAYNVWRANFGRKAGSGAAADWAPPEAWSSSAIPEPTAFATTCMAALCLAHVAAARYVIRHGRRDSNSVGH